MVGVSGVWSHKGALFSPAAQQLFERRPESNYQNRGWIDASDALPPIKASDRARRENRLARSVASRPGRRIFEGERWLMS